jgi:hypothetical protein
MHINDRDVDNPFLYDSKGRGHVIGNGSHLPAERFEKFLKHQRYERIVFQY